MTYDEWLEAPYMRQDGPPEIEDDEDALILKSAMDYIKPRADADKDEQLTGEYEAWCLLSIALEAIACDYQCRFCGKPIQHRRDKYCSRNCYRADREGL